MWRQLDCPARIEPKNLTHARIIWHAAGEQAVDLILVEATILYRAAEGAGAEAVVVNVGEVAVCVFSEANDGDAVFKAVQRVHEPQFRVHAPNPRVPRRIRGCAPIPVSSFDSNALRALSAKRAPKRKRFQVASWTNGLFVNAHGKCPKAISSRPARSAAVIIFSVNCKGSSLAVGHAGALDGHPDDMEQ